MLYYQKHSHLQENILKAHIYEGLREDVSKNTPRHSTGFLIGWLCFNYMLAVNARASARKHLLLFDQQNGICPYTGNDLGVALSPNVQIDHLLPRERGTMNAVRNFMESLFDGLIHQACRAWRHRGCAFGLFGRRGYQLHGEHRLACRTEIARNFQLSGQRR